MISSFLSLIESHHRAGSLGLTALVLPIEIFPYEISVEKSLPACVAWNPGFQQLLAEFGASPEEAFLRWALVDPEAAGV